MNAILPADIVAELESTIAGCPHDRRVRMLWRTTDLLAASRDRLQEQEINALDEVLLRIADRIEANALSQLSAVLVDLNLAPRETSRRLVLHDDPTVAGPLLLKSRAISECDLEAVATSRGEQHLLAIAGRHAVCPALTDILLKRGGKNVGRALVNNTGAAFSAAGYAMLIARAEHDSEIARALAFRPDTPDKVVRGLFPRLTPDARASILDAAAPALRERIETVLCPTPTAARSKLPSSIDYSEARLSVVALNRVGKLNDSTINRFAIRGEAANLIASLSVLSGAPIDVIEKIITDEDCEALVMACRASRLNWQTTLAILCNRGGPRLSYEQRERAQKLFDELYLSTSQWTVRWGEMAAGADAATADNNNKRVKSGASR
ncbi:DUF2336 domain-containing protein [Bradyrhizobium sp. CCGUVB1N3]|uniref:DUF2336 domain-containing protein n=1 Tax=Bradyrhizobium sp. CCGUVB1N3 TaxID=2949629 RepID=UPI0020B3C2AC|nr:DUF2336 domain-containing protein [Bradyrhizobium sp. CCGUVB1N3]MCP3469597.1 DUF2336 domain-containing protein [Bradyrhizobium sp. CCGUVB1N3]